MKTALKYISIVLLVFFVIVNLYILADYLFVAKMIYKPFFVTQETDRLENDLPFDPDKKSLITIGCSVTYGSWIKANENFSYFLQKLTRRKVYNRAIPGEGPQNILFQLQTNPFFNERDDIDPEYIIYTFISEHTRRMYAHVFNFRDKHFLHYYTYKNNKFIRRKNFEMNFIDYFYSSYLMQKINLSRFLKRSDDEVFDLLKAYLLEAKKEIDKRYKDTKLVIIVYNAEMDTFHQIEPFHTDRWTELEEAGIKVIRFDTPEYNFLNTPEYLSPVDNVHPSGKAWEVLTPIIIKELNL